MGMFPKGSDGVTKWLEFMWENMRIKAAVSNGAVTMGC